MDDICRLCLSVSSEMASTISDDSEILYTLSCLNIQITMCDFLPSKVCKTCFNILKDIQNFHESITQNEYKLMELLNSGEALSNFYYNLRHVTHFQNVSDNTNYEGTEYCESIEDLSKTDTYKQPEDDKFVLIHFIELDTKIKVEDTVAELQEVQIGYRSEYPNKRKEPEIDPIADIDLNLAMDICNEGNNCVKENETYPKEDSIDIAMAKKDAENYDVHDTDKVVDDKIMKENEEDTNCSDDDAEWLKSKNHKCLMCFQKFSKHAELLGHYKSAHYNKYVANCCDSDYTVQTRDDKTDYKCNHCKKAYGNVEDVVSHLNDHKSDRPYLCKICGRTFKQVYDILRHGRAHGNDYQLYCRHGCGYHTGYKGALRDHEKRHTKEFKYKCETCGRGFYVKTWYEQHQNIHKNLKPFVCDICGGAFHMQRYLTTHRSSVHPDVGKGVKRYTCPHCSLACYNKNSLSLHLQEHNIKMKLLCDICGKECSNREHLKHHRNTHLGVKPFSCSICNKKFPKKFNLSVHEKSHSGEKHLCQTCGKYFAQKSSLVRHIKARHADSEEEEEDDDDDDSE